jgi:hypothetical protein
MVVGDGVGDGTAEAVNVGWGTGEAISVADTEAGTVVEVEGATEAAVDSTATFVVEGSAAAISSCSSIPRATATIRVRAMSVAAISPLQSGPNPLEDPSPLPFDSQPSPGL